MDKIAELRQARATAVEELNTDAVINDAAAFETKKKEIEDLDKKIARAEDARSLSASLAQPVDNDDRHVESQPLTLEVSSNRSERRSWNEHDYLWHARSQLPEFRFNPQQHFRNLGELLVAVAAAANSRGMHVDGRLQRAPSDGRITRGPSGAAEMDPSGGGFLVQTDFASAIFARAYDMGEILGAVQKIGISGNSNGIKIPGIDETSRTTGSRWGGVQSYWVAEAGTATPTKPKFRIIELDLKKLLANWYVTDELLQDAAVMNTIANQAFAEEIMFMTEDAIFRGSGAGQPLGFLNAPCTVSVAKESGQSAGTIVYDNIVKMWSRMWGRSRPNSAWYINQDVEPQLFTMSQVIGTAGVPVYLPANGISGSPYGTLFGRPVVPVEYADTLGAVGDITLADFSQYVIADKNGVQAASSMHVAFLTDEMVFRITYRVDGEPLWHAPLTPFKGSATKSPFITLAAR